MTGVVHPGGQKSRLDCGPSRTRSGHPCSWGFPEGLGKNLPGHQDRNANRKNVFDTFLPLFSGSPKVLIPSVVHDSSVTGSDLGCWPAAVTKWDTFGNERGGVKPQTCLMWKSPFLSQLGMGMVKRSSCVRVFDASRSSALWSSARHGACRTQNQIRSDQIRSWLDASRKQIFSRII